jgi:hypothetical protein
MIETLPYFPAQFILLLTAILIIDGALRFVGMWLAARNKQLAWFVALGFFNTVGILPMVYLIFFRPEPKKIVKKQPVSKTKKFIKHSK